MIDLKELIDLYLDDNSRSLAPSTRRSRRSRLRVTEISLDPDVLYTALEKKGRKPYTIKTTFIEISQFYKWLMANNYLPLGPNVFADFMEKNRRLFKHAYEPERIEIDFDEAERRIGKIRRREIREKAYQLLYSGMRWTESLTLKNGSVKGKGGKHAPVFCPDELQNIAVPFGYDTFRRELNKVGLKPHTLRKLVATKLAQEGKSAADIKRFMRWNSINTANSYMQAVADDRLQQWSESLRGKNKDGIKVS